MRNRIVPLVRSLLLSMVASGGGDLGDSPLHAEAPWTRSAWFEEASFTTTADPQGRFHVNAPLDAEGTPARGNRLIVYALPNGNTIEQTLGCRTAEGRDWHYDIQHVAAQVRLLRALMPDERIVLVCAEAAQLSWPRWRQTQPDANADIRRMIDDWRQRYGTPAANVLLTGHSGGGSFIFGAIEAAEDIATYIDRIAFLDANYSFNARMHAAKLERWLRAGSDRHLIVVAYDDREITLDGKKVVGATGGTFRATARMRHALGNAFDLRETAGATFAETVGLDRRVRFYVHPNPANKILHTALVGDMNGLVHVATLGTKYEGKWGAFGGPRAYDKWIQPEPLLSGESSPTDPSAVAAPPLPARPANAIGGREFIKSIEQLSLDEREAAIFREISRGNFPEFLRRLQSVSIPGSIGSENNEREVSASIEVMPDYLAVGSDADFVRMPMTPQTAQRIADRFGCTLPTRKLVDAVDAHAELHLAPQPLTHEREAVATFLQHHRIIEQQRAEKPLGLLITGIKKDIVLSPRLFERPNRLAIYGWRQLAGQPIQPLSTVHSSRYVDYSHGVRLIRNRITIDGRQETITDRLADPLRCSLVSDEGPMKPPRYPVK